MNLRSLWPENRERMPVELQRISVHDYNKFGYMQLSEQVSVQENRIEFGESVVQEATLDEEFWVT